MGSGKKTVNALVVDVSLDGETKQATLFGGRGISGDPVTLRFGDVSAVIMSNLPFWAQLARTPKLEIALMSEWEEKIEKMANTTIEENVTNIVGVPTWTVVLLQRILELTGKKQIHEIWPNLEVFIHGAVSFEPYRALFKKLVPW